MPSILTKYERVDFIAAHPFLYNGVQYNKGDDVPDAKTFGNLETLVRSRRLIPVVDNYSADAPLQFRREVITRALAYRKLGLGPDGPEQGEDGYTRAEGIPSEEANVEHVETFPEEPPGTQPDWVEGADGGDSDEEYDPGEHTVAEVLDYVDEYPDELLSVYALEEQGKARTTLLAQLDDRLNEQADEEGNGNG